jgi:hypothetical protein
MYFVVQVDVYQADFNAERQARERIAGEKADLEEELRNSLGTKLFACFLPFKKNHFYNMNLWSFEKSSKISLKF